MADSVENLKIRISGEDVGATPAILDLEPVLARIAAALEREGVVGKEAGAAMAAGHAEATAAAEKHEAAETILGATIGKVETATNSASRALTALGFQTGEATERVLAFTEALDGLEAAAVPLLAIGAAFLAIGAAVNFVGEGLKNASKEQEAFNAIGVSVRAQGDSWGEAREQIEQYATALTRATTFSKGEALEAIRSLTSAGISYRDAEQIVAVATDVAAGSGRTLIDVTNEIKEAEAGRGIALAELDPKLKEIIRSHGTLSDVLNELSNTYSGQATAATDTFEGKQKVLQDRLEDLGVEIGTALIPTMTTMTDIFIGLTEEVEKNRGKFQQWADDTFGGIVKVVRGLNDLRRISNVPNASNHLVPIPGLWNPGQAGRDVKDAGAAYTDLERLLGVTANTSTGGYQYASQKDVDARNALRAREARYGDPQDPAIALNQILSTKAQAAKADDKAGSSDDWFKHLIDEAEKSGKEVRDRWEKGFRRGAGSHLQNNPHLGNQSKTGGGTPPALLDPDVFAKSDPFSNSQTALDKTLQASKDGLLQYTEAVRLATTAEGEKSAKITLAIETENRAQLAIRELTAQNASERAETERLTALLPQQEAKSRALADAYNAFARSLGDAGPQTKAQRTELELLKRAHDEAKRAANTTSEEIAKLTSFMDRNSHAIQENVAHLHDYTAIVAAAARADEARRTKELNASAVDVAKDFEKYGPGGKNATSQDAADQKIADERAMYGQSLEAQIAYLSQRYNDAVNADGQYSDEAVKLHDELQKLDFDRYKKELDEQKKFTDEAIKAESTFLDDIISKHKSLRDSLKDFWKNILDDYIAMIEQMILKSTVFTQLQGTFGKFLGGAAGGGGVATAGGIAGGSGLGALSVVLHPDSVAKLTGSGQGIATGSAQYQLNQNGAPTTAGGTTAPGAAKTSLLGGAFQGAALGGIVSSISGGNATGSSLGGALGGVLGIALHANPLIGAGIDVATSLLGGLFGNHDNPAKMPDKYDTVNYGQGVANLTGQQAGANGQTFYADTGVLGQTGGIGEIGFIEKQLAGATKGANGYYTLPDGSQLNPAQYQQFLSTFGASATGSGKLNFGHDIGQQWITGAAGASSNPTSYQAIDALAQQFLGLGGTSTASSLYTLERTYPDFNLSALKANGTYTPNASTGSSPTNPTVATGTTGLTGIGGVVGGFFGKPPNNSAPIHVTITGGTFVGPGSLDDVAHEIGIRLHRLRDGTTAGGIRANASGSPVAAGDF